MSIFSFFARPGNFRKLAGILIPFFSLLALGLGGAGLYYVFYASPVDYQQGETVRIMYVHVPAAWLALGIYVGMAVAAITAFVWKHTLADYFCRAAAPVGAAFTLICLVTGSLWGKPMWGAWWVWDARLTSMLLLFFLYLGFIALRQAFDDDARGEKAGQILLVVGLINIPIIKFSVEWWNTLHQGETVFRKGGTGLHETMQAPLFFMATSLFFLAGAVILTRILTSIELNRSQNRT